MRTFTNIVQSFPSCVAYATFSESLLRLWDGPNELRGLHLWLLPVTLSYKDHESRLILDEKSAVQKTGQQFAHTA